MVDNSKEYILCAAIWYKDLILKKIIMGNVLPKNCFEGMVFCGYRHCYCMYSMVSITGLPSGDRGNYIEGFLTSTNRFVDRIEAGKIAIACGQIEKLEYSDTQLFSEDLY